MNIIPPPKNYHFEEGHFSSRKNLDQNPNPTEENEETETDYVARGLKGSALVMGGLAVYLSGSQGPQTSVEAAQVISGAGLLTLGIGGYMVIDSALREKEQSQR